MVVSLNSRLDSNEEEEGYETDTLRSAATFIPAIVSTLEATQGQILSQSPTDATSGRWHLYGS